MIRDHARGDARAEGTPEAKLEAAASATTSMDEDERVADEAAKQRRSNGAVETQQRHRAARA